MSTTTLLQIQEMVDQLSPLEQVQLVEYLTPRIRSALLAKSPVKISSQVVGRSGWDTLFQIGDKIANLPSHGTETLTQSVSTMRR